MNSTAEAILEVAEERARRDGYHGFSFRNIAADVGIKSASVHHHFPTKESLVVALVRRYREQFLAQAHQGPSGPARARHYRKLFRASLSEGCRMCLCGVLSTESRSLPPAVNDELRGFFEALIADLTQTLDGHCERPDKAACRIIAQLEGAALLARALGDLKVFDRATENLEARA